MGAWQPGACCQSTPGFLLCCANGVPSKAADIVRARPTHSPGLAALDQFMPDTLPWPGSVAEASNDIAPETFWQDMQDELADSKAMLAGKEGGPGYAGELLAGQRHGRGTWTTASQQYAGEWRYDKRHGAGRQTWRLHGRLYEGQFMDDMLHGSGRMEWRLDSGVAVYEGQYLLDAKHGSGRYVWPDGRTYEGQWRQGLRSGEGSFTDAEGHSINAVWREDQLERWLEGGADAGRHPERAEEAEEQCSALPETPGPSGVRPPRCSF